MSEEEFYPGEFDEEENPEDCLDCEDPNYEQKLAYLKKKKFRKELRNKKNKILRNDKLLKKIGRGSKDRGKKRFNKLLKRRLYWAHELSKYDIEALSKYGYVFSNSRSKDKRLRVRNEDGQIERVLCLLPKKYDNAAP